MKAKKKLLVGLLCMLTVVFSLISLTGCELDGLDISGILGGSSCTHEWGEWSVTNSATCAQDGEQTRTCSECGKEQRETIPATGEHTYGEWTVTEEATLTEEGAKERSCSICGDVQTETIPATCEHSYSEWTVIEEATCGKEGSRERSCSLCGKEQRETIPATGEHSYGEWTVTEEATCVKDGRKERSCSICGDVQTETIPAIGEHSYGEWTATEDATCVKDGRKERSCSICGNVQTETIPAIGEHSYCEWTVTEDATCGKEGSRERSCSLCGKEQRETIPATGEHSYSEWTVIEEATCVKDGRKERSCSICGDSQVKSIEPAGHRYVDNVCEFCNEPDWSNVDLNCLDVYNGTYGYEYLGTIVKGEAMQALYEAIDKKVRIFHVDSSLDAENLSVASLNFGKLGLTADEAVSVWKTYKDDNPLYYWLANTVTCTEDCITLLTESEYADGETRSAYNTFIYNQIESYASRVSESDGFYRIALAYHDFIIDSIDYAYNENHKPEDAAWAHNIIGVFEGTGAVCEGYARSFQILLNYSGVENLFVTGTAGGVAHAWNLIRLDDGNWYWCDLTWDDSFVGGVRAGNWKWGISYNYFCVNDDTNTLWSEGGWIYDSTEIFLETHTLDTSEGIGVGFLYELPTRSPKEFSDETQELLNTKFSVDNCDFTVVGYNIVELNYITGSGNVEIPKTVTYNGNPYTVISLGKHLSGSTDTVFSSEITSVYVPETVKFIWDFAFRQHHLENIYVDEKNPWFCSQDGVLFTKSLYTLISYPSENARTEYVIPNETREIAYWSFESCKYLETLTFGKNVSSIGVTNWGSGYHDAAPNGWFGGNVVEGGIFRIGNSLAGNKAIIIDENNKYYTSDGVAIYDYDKSQILYIVDKDISTYNISANIISIESVSDIFSDCTKLETFTVEEGNQYFSVYEGILYNKDMTKILFVPVAIKGEITIHDGITSISFATFIYHINLTSIILPDSVTSIDGYAFLNCSSLTSIKIPDGVTSINFGAFSGCSSLVDITIPDSVTNIGNCAFENCSSLTSIKIPYGVTSIGNGMFCRCGNLTNITIPKSVTNIDGFAFYQCSSLTNITIPESVTSIGDFAFYECIGLESVYYTGTAEEWSAISVGEQNENLTYAPIFYFSETQPTEEGNFWHYDVDGVTPVEWGKQD